MLSGFVQYIQAECKKAKAILNLAPVQSIYISGEPALGCYDRTAKTLSVAIRNPHWPETLAHEFSHMRQHQELPDEDWDRFDEAMQLYENFMAGQQIDQVALESAIQVICEIESDAERRALDLLTSYGICEGPEYIKEANAYMFMHVYAARHGGWPDVDPTARRRRPDGIFPKSIVGDPVTHYTQDIDNYFSGILKA